MEQLQGSTGGPGEPENHEASVKLICRSGWVYAKLVKKADSSLEPGLRFCQPSRKESQWSNDICYMEVEIT